MLRRDTLSPTCTRRACSPCDARAASRLARNSGRRRRRRRAAALLCALLGGCAAQPAGPSTSRHTTDRKLDLAIDGDGYFIVQISPDAFLFTRNGQLAVAANGELVNADGYRLFPPVSVPQGSSAITITPDGTVRREGGGGISELAGQIMLSRFDRPEALERDGIYFMPTDASGQPIPGRPSTKGLGALRVGELED